MAEKAYCCYIESLSEEHDGLTLSDELLRELSCWEDAEWEICYGPTPDDYTHACSNHAGWLLVEGRENRVFPIG